MKMQNLSFDDAKDLVLARVEALPPRREDLSECLGLVLAEDVVARENIPFRTNSAMDGFAVIAADTIDASPDHPVALKILETIEAGDVPTLSVTSGACSRIMTGAIMPEGADAVVRVEDTNASGDSVMVLTSVRPGRDVRLAGEDIAEGETALDAGTELRPYEIGLLAAVGASQPLVVPRVRVAVLASGSELVPVSASLSPGKVRNSNGPAIFAQCLAVGAVPVDFGIVEDTDQATEQALEKAAETCDVIVTSGAVSMGEKDRIRPTIERLGEVIFWGVAMRPGKPVLFGGIRGSTRLTAGGKPFFGLPGNPASSMVTFEMFVRPALRKMMGHASLDHPMREARSAETITPRPGLTMFLRAVLESRDGELWVRGSGPQGSGMHVPLARANCLAVISGDRPIAQGESIPVILLGDSALVI